jgi:hypothetical protein
MKACRMSKGKPGLRGRMEAAFGRAAFSRPQKNLMESLSGIMVLGLSKKTG